MRIFVAVLMSTLFPGATAMAASKDCVHVLSPASTSIRLVSYSGGGGKTDEMLDLASGKITSLDGSRTVDAAELAAVKRVFGALCLAKAAKPSMGPPPGGAWQYEIKDPSGTRVIAYENGAPQGVEYFPIETNPALELSETWPGVKRRVAPTTERKLAAFAEEVIFGSPGGDFDMKGAGQRLDRTEKQFEFVALSDVQYKHSIQVRPKDAKLVDVAALAKEFDVANPVAICVNAEHNVWMLGSADTGKPLGIWRELGLAEIRLDMPRGTHATSDSGTKDSLKGATLDTLIVRAPLAEKK